MLKVLNLYAGIGGNRKLWKDVEVTAVEIDPKIAEIYQDFFPDDKVIIDDAHQYLLDHFKEYDFIWSSPPCQTHSVCNNFLHSQGIIRYPDMSLWQEIVFLKKWFKGNWAIENVVGCYEQLFRAIKLDRHLIWSNFMIYGFHSKRNFNIVNAGLKNKKRISSHKEEMVRLQKYFNIDLIKYKLGIRQKVFALRNCVEPELGLHILEASKARALF